MNCVILVGRLTRDPEIRQTQSGMAVASFTIAVDERKGGEKSTIFIPVSVFGKQSDVVRDYVKKGYLLGVTGRLTQRKYIRKTDNVEVTSTEIIADRVDLMEPKHQDGASQAPATPAPAKQAPAANAPAQDFNVSDDDLPF